MSYLEGDQAGSVPMPLVLAGSDGPSLDWAVRESLVIIHWATRHQSLLFDPGNRQGIKDIWVPARNPARR